MAKFTSRTKVVPLLLLLLLYNEVTGAGSRKRRRSRTDPSEEFSSHRIVTPKLYHGRSKREVTSSRDVHDVTDVTRRHLDRMTVTLGSDDDERQFVLDLKLVISVRQRSLSAQNSTQSYYGLHVIFIYHGITGIQSVLSMKQK